ncbi:SoxR reducing system RseC family protein [Citroniella saccharovorans]|uniref:SoxR reducing system RseC family protein n=1 Tax=Citroniella saccharovorans TaxID=2053367 RepID=A0AAW9MV50_9FIRM|nr:SoxR reducing system RseC family protein [Citroniella saccharovorans]MEB3429489.1 SoxR reducing system RseC family protein [Citroniella saccharovorans]
MKQVATVLKKEKENNYKLVVLRSGACGSNCSSCSSCSHAESKNHIVYVDYNEDLKPGDRVILETSNSSVIKFSFFVYIIPLVLFVFSLVISYNYLSKNGYTNFEQISFLFGIIGFCVSLLILKLIDNKIGKKSSLLRISEVIKRI